MTPEQQLTFEITRLGVIGTLIGTLLGLSIGILTTLLNRKWQREDNLRKDKKEAMDKKIIPVQEYLSNYMEKVFRTKMAIYRFFLTPTKFKAAYDDAYEDFREYINKSHILNSSVALRDKQFSEFVGYFLDEIGNFVDACPVSVLNADGEIADIAEKENWDKYEFQKLLTAYSNMVLRLDDYRSEQLGIKNK